MKITDVTVTLYEWADLPDVSYHFVTKRPGEVHDQGLLTITTDEGIQGYSLLGKQITPASANASAIIRFLKPLLVGQNPLDRERLFQTLWKRHRLAGIRAIGAVDIALWDIVGKAAGMPLWQLLGGYRTKIPVYCSSDHLPSPAAYAEEALRFKEMGWHAYKIHPNGKWQEDIEICRAVRDAVGPDYRLMLDSTFLYDFPAALRVGRAIEELDYYWYEDPLGDQDIYNYQKLKEKLDIPILATERPEAGLDSYASWITARATDFLRGDVAMKGGITNILKTAHLAEAFGMNYEVHVGGNSVNNLANLHVELAIRNCEYHEILMPLEGQGSGLIDAPVPDREGYLHAPSGPGLGSTIDFAMIEKHRIAVLS
jgi:L-alanine-DL-glutamate epimerase-like enolase superfamily enzyme